MTQRRGVSVLEVVIALALLAVGVLLVLGIVPTGISSMRRAEDISSAVAYGNDVIEHCRAKLPPAGETEWTVTLNSTDFHVKREVVPVTRALTDVVITLQWSDRTPPRVLATRIQGAPARR
ncbi:MAG: hypothetical protein EB084_09810 [Proteobacteria bacterium]|nr:hypothetical protein [Pseudomonadota bacterium]